MATTTIDSAALGTYGTYNEGVGPYYASFDIWDPPSGSYDEQITYNPSTFPNGTTLTWNFPASGGGGAVLAYPEIVYGPNQYDPISPTHDIQPLQINQINNLSVTYNVSINASDSSGYDGLIETWITTQGTTNGGQDVLANHFADEVEFLTHSPSWVSNYVESLHPQELTVDGMNLLVAKVNQSTPDVFIMPVASDWTTPVDLTSGTQTIPLGDILKAVAAAGVISGSDYVDNYQFGFEINHGSGSATINQLSYDWSASSTSTVLPPTISSYSPDSGVVGDGITNATNLTLAGAAVANSTVTIYDGAIQLGTAVANATGTWNFTTGTLANGTHAFTATDTALEATSSASSVLNVTVDTVAPVVTESLVSGTSNPALAGSGDPNAVVYFTVDGTPITSTATANASGVWTFTPTGLANGNHTIVATETDAAGNTGTASLSFTLYTATSPTVSSVVVSGSGITNGSGDLNAGHVVTLTVNMSEAVTVAGGIPTLTLNDGGTAVYTGGSGSNALTFSYTVAAGQNTPDLAVTAVNLNSATVTDAAGNAAVLTAAVTTPAGTLQIDTTAPAAPVIISDSPASGTAVNSVTLTGTAEANSTVNVYAGASVVGTVTANSAGAWSYTTGTLASGSYTFTATATDAAGNVSTISQPIDPTIGSNTYPANNTTLTITDSNDTVILSGSNDTVNLTGSNDAIQLSGSNDQLIITGNGNSVNVTGLNDSVSSTGADVVTFSGSGGNTVDATIGSGTTLNRADSLSGSGNDTLALTGNSATVNLNQLAHFSGFSGISLSGSNDTLTLTNANLTVMRLSGSGDTIKLGTGIDTVAYTNVNQSTHSSHDTFSGFNAHQDKIDFSAISGLNSNTQHVTMNFLTSTPTNIAAHTIDVVTIHGSTMIYANATGSSESISANHEDMQINLTGVAAMNSSDFILHH